jgi:tetratricopeptide (TPR) repeat protein
LSYGDGITYWPLREVLAGARESGERAAVLAALEAKTPLPAPELAYLFRRFCEAEARAQPLILVFDDLHWAEPTFLELVEHVADKGEGPILVVCLAREELAESQPDFLEGRANADRIELDVLAGDEVEALVDGLGGGILDTDQRARVVGTAEGNPLFLEQLLALALEGGLVEQRVPETVQALLAARLERLGPGERAVLERAAVIGKEFRLDDVAALLDPEAAPTADVHVSALAARGFVRPAAAGEFRFRHVLVQDAVYRAAPKRLRADLHERFIDRFALRHEGTADIDEFAGYHLEQAYRLRTELGESDRRTGQLGEDAASRLGAAGVRAAKRGDIPAAVGLLGRATGIQALSVSQSADLRTELGMSLRVAGKLEESNRMLQSAVELAQDAGDRRVEMRARVESAFVRVMLLSENGDELLQVTKDAIPVFEAAGDHRSLGRALSLAGWMEGGHRGRHRQRLQLAERALVHYRQSTWPVTTPVGEIANALYYGPTPVADAIERLDELGRSERLDRNGRANIDVCVGGLLAQTGAFDQARALIASARAVYDDLGQRAIASTQSAAVLGDVELLAGDLQSAETTFRWLCLELERAGVYSHLASRAGDLAETLYALGRMGEASDWLDVAERHSATDDVDARVLWMPVRAKLLARQGMVDRAVGLANEAIALAGTGDALNRTAKAHRDLGEVLVLSDRIDEARDAYSSAAELYEAKGNVVGARLVPAFLADDAVA